MKPLEEKAVRLVLEQRVDVKWYNDDWSAASGTVEGDHGTYQAEFDPEGHICTCPAGAHNRKCSHSLSLELEVRRMQEGVTV